MKTDAEIQALYNQLSSIIGKNNRVLPNIRLANPYDGLAIMIMRDMLGWYLGIEPSRSRIEQDLAAACDAAQKLRQATPPNG